MSVLETINCELLDNINTDGTYDMDQVSTEDNLLNPALPVKVKGENNTELLLFEKDLRLDPNIINGALFNWTEHIIHEKTVKFRNRTVSIVGASKSKEQLRDEFERAKSNNNNITSIKQLEKQLPICGDVEARMYFAILKLFYQNSINGIMPRKIFTTYQEIKSVMGLAPTFPTPDLKDSLFRLAHTRYEFKDSYSVKSGDEMALIKQSHSLYLLSYYELEVEKLKEKITHSEDFEDFEPISAILKTLLNKRGKPTASLLKITLDEEQWKNLSRGYNLLYSYEHLKLIPKAVARGLYLFLDPNQGVLFTNGRITRTNNPNVFMVKAQYIIEYLGSSETNPTKSLNRVNKALDILKREGYIKNYQFATNSRKVLDGVYDIEFYPEQSRNENNKYASFMVKVNPNALTVPIVEKREIDHDFEKVMEKFYTLLGGERLLTTTNKVSLKTIYYDEDNIKIATYMALPLDKHYGYYYLNGILYALTAVKSKDLNALIKGVILAENNTNSKKSGYKNHSIKLMKNDFIIKYGQDKYNEISQQVIEDVKYQFDNKYSYVENTDIDKLWQEIVNLYQDVYKNDKGCLKINEFNLASKTKILKEYEINKFYAIKLMNYVLVKGKEVNAYLSMHGVNQKFYVDKGEANALQAEYEKRLKETADAKSKEEKEITSKKKEIENQRSIEVRFNNLPEVLKERYIEQGRSIISKYASKLHAFKDLENKIKFSLFAVSNGEEYDIILEKFVENHLQISLKV